MKTCHICGAAMRDDERVCPTCGSSTAADPYSPGHALVAEVEDAPLPAGPSTALDYGVKMELEAVLSKGFNLWGGSLGRLVATQIPWMVCFVPMIVILALMFTSGNFEAPTVSFGFMATLAVCGFAIIPATLVAQAASLLVLNDRARGHEPPCSAMAALHSGLGFIGRQLLAWLVVGNIAMISFVPAVVLLVMKEWLAGALAFIPAIAFCFYLLIWVAPLQSVLVVEDLPLGPALRRCSELLRGCKWKVLGYALMAWLVVMTLGGAVGFIGLIPIFGQIVTLAVNLLLTPLWNAIFFSMYAALSDRHRAAARPL